jgi:hypothetical protein
MVVHTPCLQDAALPEDRSRRNVPPVRLRRVAACMLSEQSPTDDKGQSSWLGAGRRTHNPSPLRAHIVMKCYRMHHCWTEFERMRGFQLQASAIFNVWPWAPGTIMIGGWIGHIYLFWWKQTFKVKYVRASISAYRCHTSVRLQANGKL